VSLSSETSRQQFSGDGSTVLFAVPFHFETLSTDVRAILTDEDGVDTELTYVSGSSPATGQFALVSTTLTGNLYTAANVKTGDTPTSDEKVTILRGTPLKQTTDIQAADGFPPTTLELSIDRVVMMIQKLEEQLDRSLLFRAGYKRIRRMGSISSGTVAEISKTPQTLRSLIPRMDWRVFRVGPPQKPSRLQPPFQPRRESSLFG
jgi:hypothetical protein